MKQLELIGIEHPRVIWDEYALTMNRHVYLVVNAQLYARVMR